MCFFRFLGRSRIWPTFRPSSPCRTRRSTGASYPHSICLLFFPLPPMVAASPASPVMFTVRFWLLFPSYPGFLAEVMYGFGPLHP